MRVLLLSTYELGRQPFGLASAAAWLRRAGHEVACADASRQPIPSSAIESAALVAVSLPMHTATRLAMPLLERIKELNPDCCLCCFGLYAPLNGGRLRAAGVDAILGPEFEEELVALAEGGGREPDSRPSSSAFRRALSDRDVPRLAFIQPDRSALPPLGSYARLRMGTEARVAGYTEATRGCKHRCRHCPIVPVYGGRFRAIPRDVVLADIRDQVERGAQHITFGDPDFFNGTGHAIPLVRAFAGEFPGVTYDVTIKIEHLLRHADLLPELARTGCLFVTSAVESIDDRVLVLLQKRHCRADFERAVTSCRSAGLTLAPTFVAFTPWTTTSSYLDLLETIRRFNLVPNVAPVQLALRLLVPEGSLLLELEEIRKVAGPFDTASLVYPWRHEDARVDELQDEVMRLVGARPGAGREDVFEQVFEVAARRAGKASEAPDTAGAPRPPARARATVPYLDEPWYC